MSQSGYTPILIYASGTTGNAPDAANLTSSASGAELALNYFDGKLFYKDNAGAVQVLATKGGVGTSTNTQVLFNDSGLIAGDAGFTFNKTSNVATITGGAILEGLTVGRGAGAVSTNTAVGASALAANTTGTDTTAIGYQAGYSNTTGARNTFVGEAAGYLVTTGSDNTTLGFGALASGGGSGGSAANNVAVGTSALKANTASNNTAVGYQAGFTNTTGANMTAVGTQAGYSNTTGEITAIGEEALKANTTGAFNTGVGVVAMLGNTTGSYNTAVGRDSLRNNTTGENNAVLGYQAGYSQTTNNLNTYIGYQAGKYFTGSANVIVGARTVGSSGTPCTGNYNTLIGDSAGAALQGASTFNTFIGEGAGGLVTAGNYNTVLGGFNGNQGGLDIRTSSNYIVLSDGNGNPRGWFDGNGSFFVRTSTGQTAFAFDARSGSSAEGSYLATFTNSAAAASHYLFTGNGTAVNTAAACYWMYKNSANSRSINCAGTVNASGADYAEYMVKTDNFAIAKGDLVGIDAQGKLTNIFADAISFVVKSTDPSYVGGDTWGSEDALGISFPKYPEGNATDEEKAQYEADKAAFDAALEAARQTVDRIAFAGQVPVNVLGATAGQYIIPVNDNGAIKGIAVNEADMTLTQYMKAVGKVIAIEQDGRAKIIVKVA